MAIPGEILQEDVGAEFRAYAKTRFTLLQYELTDRGAAITAHLAANFVILACLVQFFLFSIMAGAFYLSGLLHSYWAGFGCTSVGFLLIVSIVRLLRRRMEKRLVNHLIKRFFR